MLMGKLTRSLMGCLLLISMSLTIAQAQEAIAPPSEGRLWMSVAGQFKLDKDWNLQLEQQLRFDREGRTFQQTFTDIELEYEIGKRGDVFQEYRISFRENRIVQRIGTGVSYKAVDAKPWFLSIRGKFQHDFSPSVQNEGNWRTKSQLRYRLNKRWSLYGSAEGWSELYPYASVISRVRTGGGASFDRKHYEFRLQYFYERSLGIVFFESGQSHILSIGYTRTP